MLREIPGALATELHALEYRGPRGRLALEAALSVAVAVVCALYVHSDQLDSPRVVTSTSGTSEWAWAWQTNPFGETMPTGILTLNLRFPGQYFDTETGLNYNVMRDYETQTGRYAESDPAGLSGDLATYSYAFVAPLRWIDRRGLAAGESDERCCDQARQRGDFQNPSGQGEDWGIVECCKGKKVACSNVPRSRVPDETAYGIVSGCVRKHEEQHLLEVTCPDCKTQRPGRNPGVDPKASECNARRAEIRCLTDGGKGCGNDPVCHSQVDSQRDARTGENSQCGS